MFYLNGIIGHQSEGIDMAIFGEFGRKFNSHCFLETNGHISEGILDGQLWEEGGGWINSFTQNGQRGLGLSQNG